MTGQPNGSDDDRREEAVGSDTERGEPDGDDHDAGGAAVALEGQSGDRSDAETVFCRSCGERIRAAAEICPHCGVRQPVVEAGGRKNPGLAAVASLVIPGAGQIYNGQILRGLVALVGTSVLDVVIVVVALVLSLILIGPLFLLLVPVVHVLVAYDAYAQAEKINRGEVVP